MNLLPATLAAGGTGGQLDGGPLLAFADGPRPGADGMKLTIGIRPEHVALVASGLALTIDLVDPLESETVLIRRLADGEMLSVKVAGPAPPGEVVQIAFPSASLHVFNAATGLRLDPPG